MGIPALDITARTTLGAKLVLSAAYFEAGAAELIGAEGLKLQKLAAAASEGFITVTSLTSVNREIMLTMSALSNLENAILRKIEAGTHLHNSATW